MPPRKKQSDIKLGKKDKPKVKDLQNKDIANIDIDNNNILLFIKSL